MRVVHTLRFGVVCTFWRFTLAVVQRIAFLASRAVVCGGALRTSLWTACAYCAVAVGCRIRFILTLFATGEICRIRGHARRAGFFGTAVARTEQFAARDAIETVNRRCYFGIAAAARTSVARSVGTCSHFGFCISLFARSRVSLFRTCRIFGCTCPARLTAVAGAALDISVGTAVLQSVVAPAFTVSDGADFQAVIGTGARPVRILTAVLVRAAMAVLQARLAVAVAVRIGRGAGAYAFACRADFSAVAGYFRTRVCVNTLAAAVCDLSVGTAAFFAFGARVAVFANFGS